MPWDKIMQLMLLLPVRSDHPCASVFIRGFQSSFLSLSLSLSLSLFFFFFFFFDHPAYGGRNWRWRPPCPSVGIITGFYVPLGTPPAAETDGPVGAAMLAGALTQVGVSCRLATDEPCRATCAAALQGMDVPLDVVPLGGAVDDTIARWRRLDVTHALSIERCGRSADGAPRNMRGEDISAFTTPLDDLFSPVLGSASRSAMAATRSAWVRCPLALIGAHVAHGETIACATRPII